MYQGRDFERLERGCVWVYQCGDQVVYGIHGVCKILAVELRVINRKKVEYFVLAPIEQPDARFYVPTQNQAAMAKIRPLMSPDELKAVFFSEGVYVDCWISDENQRKHKYRELIGSVNTADLIAMVRVLHLHRSEQIASGRKFHLCDENFLRDAEKLLNTEISIVMNIPNDQVRQFVHSLVHN